SLRDRLVGTAVGAAVLYAVNALRILSLIAVGAYARQWFDAAHLYAWQLLFLAVVAACWLGLALPAPRFALGGLAPRPPALRRRADRRGAAVDRRRARVGDRARPGRRGPGAADRARARRPLRGRGRSRGGAPHGVGARAAALALPRAAAVD